ncbi:Lipid A export ATP-binding/permease protein MsbA [Flavobacterium columnare]|uniref:ATP-binding cassette domain-containing protein n=2 Tax=Flavobacterium TaxID=237 RepID=A0A2N9P820_9FLAO|nr:MULTISPECIES: ATP-binding cassette domain-containing protein [Flavobacterium]QYS88258.1 ATP-binding cassette domain-containing protein [Flavobacterium davisii]RVU89865.1 ATP-binding cassette domain-containing protein [Flavobacterium columnare]SPE76497.1 Lipid A export ATP-binding/permease protein MsbA [Flavobacterium columnare]
MTPFERFKKLISLDKRDISQIFLYAIFAGIISLSLPLGIQSIINFIQAGQVSTSWIVLVFIVIVGVALGGTMKIMQFRITENLQQKIFVRASFEFAYRFPRIKTSEFRDEYPPELANRFFDTLSIQKGVSKLLLDISTALLQILFGIVLLSLYHSFFIFFGILLTVLLYLIYQMNFKAGLATSLKESKYKYKVAHWLQEIARNHISFKNQNLFLFSLEKNDKLVNEYLEQRESHFKILRKQFIQLVAFKILLTAGLLIIGGLLVLNQQMNIGQFVAAEIVILSIVTAVEKLFSGLELFYDVLTSLEKLGTVVDKEVETLVIEKGLYKLERKSPISIETKDLALTYKGSDTSALSHINIKIESKDRILIKGDNGAGKSTLIRLLARLIEPTSGTIYLNNVNYKKYSLEEFRAIIGVITLNETPFEGTILENITGNNPTITMEQIANVLERVKLTEVIKNLPNGLDTQLFPEGKQINSSVTQKIVLARCIIQQPKILFLEEPVDKTDDKSAKEIIDYLTSNEHDWTLIVISKDLYWEQKCNKTFTIDNGHLV